MKVAVCYWKDDSFRTLGKPFNSWTDNRTPTQLLTNGDEITIPSDDYATRGSLTDATYYLNLDNTKISYIDVRARSINAASSFTFTFYYDDSTTYNVVINVDTYYQYTTILFSDTAKNIIAISLDATASSEPIVVDFIALEYNPSISIDNIGGAELDISIPKKTPIFRIPNAQDVVQQLGISAKTYEVQFPKVDRTSYNWFDARCLANSLVVFDTPTYQGTGLISSVSGTTEAGWSTYYDVSVTFIKGDVDFPLAPGGLSR